MKYVCLCCKREFKTRDDYRDHLLEYPQHVTEIVIILHEERQEKLEEAAKGDKKK